MTPPRPPHIADLVAGMDATERAQLLVELLGTLIREGSPLVPAAVEETTPAESEEAWPYAMRVEQASEYTGYSKDHLRDLANAGRVGHRLDGDPTSNAPWVFLRTDLERLLHEHQDDYSASLLDLSANRRGRTRRHRLQEVSPR